MTTIINNPGGGDGSGGGMGPVIGIVILVIIVAFFLIYGLPAIQNSKAPQDNNSLDINVKLPAGESNSDNSTPSN